MNTASTDYIDPFRDIGSELLSVEKPSRYIGGEYGRLANLKKDALLKTAIAFPDLYEIGMSNQAIKILYNAINALDNVFCDRVFAPAPDFRELLFRMGLPLYGLDTGIKLKHLDLLMFSFGYELGLTTIFSILDISGIPLYKDERKNDDPIIIMGGPCVSNPLPYSNFIDAFWIGEAEAGFFDLLELLKKEKEGGGKRDDLFQILIDHESVWTKGKEGATRAIDTSFSEQSIPSVFPVPSMQIIHHHGSVEIMRGCPNGCRFCHAGYWYRPMRQKRADLIESEASDFINKGGFREITLSSLSSGDYNHLDELFESLTSKYSGRNISFQLPSLKVSGFSLDLIEKVSRIRKSGLTFAIETPDDFKQMALNKQVENLDLVIILKEAKKRGWKSAKFYFMIGLPESDHNEDEVIISFIEKISSQTKMKFNINIGTFIPKPHTPYQQAAQLEREEADRRINNIRFKLKAMGHKTGVQDTLLSVIEGIASRGDERAGELFHEAFKRGCTLDAWSEYFKRNVWEEIIETNREMVNTFLAGRKNKELPWEGIYSGVRPDYLKNENSKSSCSELTSTCIKNCNKCGICNKKIKIVKNIIQNKVLSDRNTKEISIEDSSDNMSNTDFLSRKDPDTHRMVFSFSKKIGAVFHSHLTLVEIFSMNFLRANIPVLFSMGFNPLPRQEFASPLSLGIRACAEIAMAELKEEVSESVFIDRMNSVLPEGILIEKALYIKIRSGEKKHSLSSLLWGSSYSGENGDSDLVEAKYEKAYRKHRLGLDSNNFSLERISVLARLPGSIDNAEPISYFDAYKTLYNAN